MNTKQKRNWVLDAILFVIFIFTFLLDLTGVVLHQWLGMIAGAIAAIHLVMHWKWVQSVTSRFFENTSVRARLYYLMDVGILAGFAVMIFTGVVISTWLNLALPAYEAWKMIHVGSSIFTLVVLLIKLGAHWKWIVCMLNGYRKVNTVGNTVPSSVQPQTFQRDRREFVKVMGIVTVASAIALTKSFQSLVQASPVEIGNLTADQAVQTQVVQLIQGTQQANAVNQTTSLEITTSGPTSTVQATATVLPTQTAAPTQESVANLVSTSCSIRCNRGCSFSGHCRRYTDSNGNGNCDLTECA